MRSVVLFCALLLLASPALAVPAISCHCFRDRSFKPERPAAADPYLLATTQNSFISATLGIEKKTIVRAKMSGASGDELWVEGYVAHRGELPVRKAAEARSGASSWREALVRLDISPAALGERFTAAAAGGADETILAEIAAEEMLQEDFGISPAELVKLRSDGAGTKEIILAELLSGLSRQPAPALYKAVAEGSETWGKLLHRSGMTAAGIEEAVRRRVEGERKKVKSEK